MDARRIASAGLAMALSGSAHAARLPAQFGKAFEQVEAKLVKLVVNAPLLVLAVLIVLFSLEHIIALLRGEEVEPSWH